VGDQGANDGGGVSQAGAVSVGSDVGRVGLGLSLTLAESQLGVEVVDPGLDVGEGLGGGHGAVVVGDQGSDGGGVSQTSAVAVGSQIGRVGLSLGFALTELDEGVGLGVGVVNPGLNVGEGLGGHNGAVVVGDQGGGVAVAVGGGQVGGVSLSLTLAEQVVASVQHTISLSGKVSVGGSNVVGVEGNGGAVSVLDEGSVPGAGRPNNGKEQNGKHVDWLRA